MRDRLMQHDLLIPILLAWVLGSAALLGGEELGWSYDARNWAGFGGFVLALLLSMFMYEHGRGRNGASGS
jgi:hypothetical protein